ncbi:Stp1/IreP family PP2C-type Ser/Thr phosphatase [Endozoicomonas numazuensis]|uniref:Stp1/IreP family PP2C-type Ser/Thr phosphatase n=1 Tax=Endozoicomonas numazuensis TaxID=1137799 RepID=UPI0006908660|nr:Stp1/IreP family PP2C-type Ser/Thr phosphatase [Endozoicomonas numazuensis]
MFRIAIDGKSDIGRIREENEDSLYWQTSNEDAFSLIVVADGMGGYHGGARASQLAVEIISQRLKSIQSSTFSSCTPQQQPMILKSEIFQAITEANQRILEEKVANPQLQQMGTTIVVAVIWQNKLVVTNIGDSRAYLWDSRYGLKQLTRDHSVVQNMIDSGALSEEDARTSNVRNQLTQALGIGPKIDPRIAEFDLTGDSILLLCSDGLTEYFDNDEIEYVLSTHRPALECCYRFIEEANRLGGKDNITVAIADCCQVGQDMNIEPQGDKTVPYSA